MKSRNKNENPHCEIKKLAVAVLLLTVSCSYKYDDFFNPKTFNVMASRDNFSILDDYYWVNRNQIYIKAQHNPTGAEGYLYFTKSSWKKDDSTTLNINLTIVFKPDSKEEEYKKFLASASQTKEEVKDAAQTLAAEPKKKEQPKPTWYNTDLK